MFPKYETVFSKVGIFGKTSKTVLSEFSSPDEFHQVSAETLAETFKQTSHNSIAVIKANVLKDAASRSFGICFAQDAFTFQLRSMIDQLSFLEEQIKQTENETEQLMISVNSIIETITGATVLSESDDFHRFSTPKIMVAYLKIDVSVTQFGQYEATHNVISKGGSPYLHKALFQ